MDDLEKFVYQDVTGCVIYDSQTIKYKNKQNQSTSLTNCWSKLKTFRCLFSRNKQNYYTPYNFLSNNNLSFFVKKLLTQRKSFYYPEKVLSFTL